MGKRFQENFLIKRRLNAFCFVCPQIRYSWLYLKLFCFPMHQKKLHKTQISNMHIDELTFRYTLLHNNIYKKILYLK